MVKLAGKNGVWSSIPSIVGVWQSLWDHGTYEHPLGWMAPRYGLHQFTQWKPFPKNAPPTMENHGNSMMHSQPIDSFEWNSVSWRVIFKRFTNWGLVKLGGRCLKLMLETTETLPIVWSMVPFNPWDPKWDPNWDSSGHLHLVLHYGAFRWHRCLPEPLGPAKHSDGLGAQSCGDRLGELVKRRTWNQFDVIIRIWYVYIYIIFIGIYI